MIEVSNLRSAGVENVPAGSFFAPSDGKESEQFLGGFMLGERVLVHLETMTIAPVKNWDRASGFVVSGARIEVDRSSARRAGDGFEPGAVLLVDDRLAIAARGNDRVKYVAAIDRDENLSRPDGPNDIAFSRWQAVIKTGPDKETIFAFGRD